MNLGLKDVDTNTTTPRIPVDIAAVVITITYTHTASQKVSDFTVNFFRFSLNELFWCIAIAGSVGYVNCSAKLLKNLHQYSVMVAWKQIANIDLRSCLSSLKMWLK